MLRRLSQLVDRKTLLMIYHGTIMSHISYGIEIWGGAAHSHLEKLFIQQKKAVRIIFNLKYMESCRETFKNESLFTLFSLYIFRTILFIKTYKNRDEHNEILKMKRSIEYNLRGESIHMPFCKLEKTTKSTIISGHTFYNALPTQIKTIENTNTFKQTLKNFLMENSIYSINEFWEIVRTKRP